MLKFNGFYISPEKKAIIEAPTPSGRYTFESYMMYRFYASGIWIRANSFDTGYQEFWKVSQKITKNELLDGAKRGNIWLKSHGRNHSLDIGEYEIEKGMIFISFEYKLSAEEQPIYSEMDSWKIEKQHLSNEENGSKLNYFPSSKT